MVRRLPTISAVAGVVGFVLLLSLLTQERTGALGATTPSCRSHFQCRPGQFCSRVEACEAESVCLQFGYSYGLGNYCPCLPGSITGQTALSGIKPSGTPITVEFRTTNVGPAVHLQLQGETSTQTMQEFVRVEDSAVTSVTWTVPLSTPSGQYRITVTSIATTSIVGYIPATGTFTIKRRFRCISHDSCGPSEYCDIYGVCVPCNDCLRFVDAIDGECPFKCFETPPASFPEITFRSPTTSTVVSAGSAITITWFFNQLVLDFIDLYIVPMGSSALDTAVIIRTSVAAGQYTWTVPSDMLSGDYWIAAVFTDDAERTIIGHAPNSIEAGSVGFSIQGCPTCSDNEYLTGPCGGKVVPKCMPCTECSAGTYETRACTLTSNRACDACVRAEDCGSGEYLAGKCTATTSPKCQVCTTAKDCGLGEVLLGTCGGASNPVCVACESPCRTCAGTTRTCKSCVANTYLSGSTCVDVCPEGMYGDVTSGTCTTCAEECEACAGGTSQECTACAPGYFLSGTACVSVCPDGYYGDATSRVCVRCAVCREGTFAVGGCSGVEDTLCQGWRVCASDEYEVRAPSATSDRECTACRTSCPAGKELAGICGGSDGTRDRVCEDCGSGTFKASEGGEACSACRTVCADEHYLSGACTTTQEPVCERCIEQADCRAGQYAGGTCGGSDGRSNRECLACHGTCAECVGPTATDCTACSGDLHLDDGGACVSECDAGFFEVGNECVPCDGSCLDCNGDGPGACTACAKGTFLHRGECVAVCPDETYGDVVQRQCQVCKVCSGDEYVLSACGGTSNTQCSALSVCGAGQYEAVAATLTSDRECADCRTSCPAGEELSVACTATADAQCTPCVGGTYKASAGSGLCAACTRECGDGEYLSGVCSATTTPVCAACTSTCAAGQYLDGVCGGRSNPQCTACTECSAGTYETRACTLTSNRACDACVRAEDCGSGEYLAGKCTATTSPKCQVCTTAKDCGLGEVLLGTCGGASNPVCVACESPCRTCAGTTRTCKSCVANTYLSAVRECTAGQEYETQAPTATSNRACAPLTTCDFETQFESQVPTATSNRVCTPLSSCDAETQYETQAPTQTSDRECEGLATCVAGEFVATQPTPTSNRVCASCPAGTTDHDSDSETACVACPAGHFSSAGSIGPCSLYMCPAGTADTDSSASTPCEACDGTSSFQPAAGQASCLQVTTCVAGEEEQDAPTAVSDRECRPCQLGVTYKAQPGQNTTCAAVRTCLAGEEQTLAPTLSSNRVCTTCGPGTFKAAAGQATSCIATQNCAPGFQESVAPTPASDRQCEACPTGTFKSTTGQATCTAHATCDTDTQYQTKAPTTSTNRECGPLTDCGTGEWEERAPTATSDRVCELCDSCEDEGLTQATACTETANTVCENCDTCNPGFFVSSPCTSVSQTECTECAECGADQYQTQECRVSTNTQCAPLTTCTASQYETVAPTDTSDRECATLTTCVVGQYECVAPTETSNRQCCAIAQCDVGEEEAVAPTATSNRQCQNCTAGTTDDDANGATPCVQCPAGTFVPEGRTGDCSAYRCAPGTVDADQLPSTPCTPCSSGVSFAPTSGLTACVAVSDCPAGEEESVQPTLSSDRVCTVCAAGTFKEDAGQDDCMTASTCASGTQYVAQPHTPTSDTVCANVTQCTATQYQTVAPTAMSDRQCRNLTVCEANEYQTRAPTATTDRQCATVRAACSMDEFESAAPTATSDRECTQLTTCRAQQYEARAPTPSTDRECIYWTNCTAAQFQVTAPTSVSDRVCANLTVCTATQFEAVAPTTTTNRVCESCTACPGGTHYEMTPCTASADATCAMCSTCSGDTYASAACSETDDTTCTACTQCVDGSTFESSPCLAHDDRVCLPCTVCNVTTEYVGRACNVTSDTQCLPYTTCAVDEYEHVAVTRTSDRQCLPLSVCTEVQFISAVHTTTSNRVCQDVRSCVRELEYEAAAPTPTTDRVCEAVAVCVGDEIEVMGPTSTSNRVCRLVDQAVGDRNKTSLVLPLVAAVIAALVIALLTSVGVPIKHSGPLPHVGMKANPLYSGAAASGVHAGALSGALWLQRDNTITGTQETSVDDMRMVDIGLTGASTSDDQVPDALSQREFLRVASKRRANGWFTLKRQRRAGTTAPAASRSASASAGTGLVKMGLLTGRDAQQGTRSSMRSSAHFLPGLSAWAREDTGIEAMLGAASNGGFERIPVASSTVSTTSGSAACSSRISSSGASDVTSIHSGSRSGGSGSGSQESLDSNAWANGGHDNDELLTFDELAMFDHDAADNHTPGAANALAPSSHVPGTVSSGHEEADTDGDDDEVLSLGDLADMDDRGEPGTADGDLDEPATWLPAATSADDKHTENMWDVASVGEGGDESSDDREYVEVDAMATSSSNAHAYAFATPTNIPVANYMEVPDAAGLKGDDEYVYLGRDQLAQGGAQTEGNEYSRVYGTARETDVAADSDYFEPRGGDDDYSHDGSAWRPGNDPVYGFVVGGCGSDAAGDGDDTDTETVTANSGQDSDDGDPDDDDDDVLELSDLAMYDTLDVSTMASAQWLADGQDAGPSSTRDRRDRIEEQHIYDKLKRR
ncbi:hypothetical protein PTSG_10095 [Salpingoeca rosetta]|uniref:TNFR-Cys domain-containing protein n=1 Tax=Salpingoeca rosetta (strain ATCC 50818 / BSB-021) TaxID=946362 RepID=F2UPH0_SALR5|nr:uncharacterized protein PTSG_10095 [Salpingoeca rosetta]EGD79525.1 hypothetical protein PTSG_10095 [Salpingoeca rosetta]|eukprot:XP_004989006.1 hypothetical protein PTSG_10095 [Salpingoeca rosetta]